MQITVGLRQCIEGEQFVLSGAWVQWQKDTEYLLTRYSSPGSWKECQPTKMRCFGGSDIGPMPGYWRRNNETDNFIEWFHSPACQGYDKVEFTDNTGNCSEGYYGKLWSGCKVDYSREGVYQCSKCPDPVVNAFVITLILIAYVVSLVLTVKSTLSGALDRKDIQSAYIKIIVVHFQLLGITSSFDFRWSPQIVTFFDSSDLVANVSTRLFAFDCFLDNRNNDGDTDSVRVYYKKMIIYALLPILLGLFSLIFWSVLYCTKRSMGKDHLIARITATMIVVFFNLHPAIVAYMFSNFK